MLDVTPEISDALLRGIPVVALETTLIAHGIPRPDNLELASRLESIVRKSGAIPGTIGIIDGRLRVGMTPEEIELMANANSVEKCSTRDIARVAASGGLGATTIAATAFAAARAGIRFLATGGLGGVHPGGEVSMDVSADIFELTRSNVVLFCSGPKIILDLQRTLEVIETNGLVLVGYQTNDLAGFYVRETGVEIPRIDHLEGLAALIQGHASLGWPSAIIVANPPPLELAYTLEEFAFMLGEASATAERSGVHGKDVTPLLLADLARLSAGRTVALNKALVLANAKLAAESAVAASAMTM